MKSALILTLTTLLCFSSFEVLAWTKVGNGAGGVKQNEEVKTFATANISVYRKPESLHDIPGLTFLIENLSQNNFSKKLKYLLLNAAYPKLDRNYYRVVESSLTPELHDKIVRHYSSISNRSPEQIVLFALTIPEKKETLLLPDFYHLNQIEQAAILFHEAIWVIKPSLSYEEVIQLEFFYQNHLENPRDPEAYSLFHSRLGASLDHPLNSIYAALKFDQRYAPSPYLTGKGLFNTTSLFGRVQMDCIIDAMDQQQTSKYRDCIDELLPDLMEQSITNRDLLSIRAMIDFLSLGGTVHFSRDPNVPADVSFVSTGFGQIEALAAAQEWIVIPLIDQIGTTVGEVTLTIPPAKQYVLKK